MGMGMIVSKPWGDSYRYDFICDTNGKLWRAQVRSTEFRFGARGYQVHASVYVGRKIVGLTEKDIDVLIGYIVSRDIWYVVPVRAFTPRKNLWFYPDGSKKGAMFEKFREAWGVDDGEEVRLERYGRRRRVVVIENGGDSRGFHMGGRITLVPQPLGSCPRFDHGKCLQADSSHGSGCRANLDRGGGCNVAGSASEASGVLLGADFRHRDYSVDH